MRSLIRAIAIAVVVLALAGPTEAQRFGKEHELLEVDDLPFSEDDIRQVVANVSAKVKGVLVRTDRLIEEARKNIRSEMSRQFVVNLKNDLRQADQLGASINELILIMPYLSADGVEVSARKKKVDETTRLLFAARGAVNRLKMELDANAFRLNIDY